MQTSNADQLFRSNHPVWILLAESPVNEFVLCSSKGEHSAGFPNGALRELGVSPGCVESITHTMARFAREALVRWTHASSGMPGFIRVICQKKLIIDAHAENTPRLDHSERSLEQARVIHRAGAEMAGGWGFFLIERSGDTTVEVPQGSPYFIELYVYKEG